MRPHTLHPGAIQGKEGIKFCHLATQVKNCEDEVALRDAELAALEKEINPMLSDDKTVAFR